MGPTIRNRSLGANPEPNPVSPATTEGSRRTTPRKKKSDQGLNLPASIRDALMESTTIALTSASVSKDPILKSAPSANFGSHRNSGALPQYMDEVASNRNIPSSAGLSTPTGCLRATLDRNSETPHRCGAGPPRTSQFHGFPAFAHGSVSRCTNVFPNSSFGSASDTSS